MRQLMLDVIDPKAELFIKRVLAIAYKAYGDYLSLVCPMNAKRYELRYR